jgi:hypothetical protein
VYARLGDRVARIRVRTLGLIGGLAVLVIGLVMALAFLRWDARDDAAPAPSAAPSAPPVANANGQPVPGPTPASAPVAQAQASSRFGLNAQKLLDEVRSHGITFSTTTPPSSCRSVTRTWRGISQTSPRTTRRPAGS